jgi:LmbE family N-acetylglucosaminyl deacetylase
VSDDGRTIDAIKAVIDETEPDVVYTHTPRNVHPALKADIAFRT